MGLGDCKDNAKALEMAVNELTAIAGQKPHGYQGEEDPSLTSSFARA